MAKASDSTRTPGARCENSRKSDPAAFIAAAMAPLPESAEPASTREFIRDIGKDLERLFWRQLHVCTVSKHWRMYLDSVLCVAINDEVDEKHIAALRDKGRAAREAYRRQARKLLMLPAPSIYHLDIKKRLIAFAGDEETGKVMEADAARLAIFRRPKKEGRR
jgi:aminoglycoside phosphotransferase